MVFALILSWLSGAAVADDRDPSVSGGMTTARVLQMGAHLDFTHDVAPILSANCYRCHGFDERERKSGLRLDQRDGAIQPAESGTPAIVPGKPDESELVRRIFSANDDERMPPPDSKKSLKNAQKQTLRRWIAEGAEYKAHWAFVRPQQASLPVVRMSDWPRNPIDSFVMARLEREGLHPSPEADRYTLVRRVCLDLVGLPPTPEEADAFVRNSDPRAYEHLVDRLLSSPHYGERWARRWLDLARYADTNGFEKDRPRSIWPYRDWVIAALNADMPFDEFTIEQVAGDMLPNATAAERIATGFHRNTMRNEEGGIDPLEYRYYSLVDRVATTGTTWLGLTVGCAQCHSHKYDPITQTDYYRLMAFLDNADEPEIDVPDAAIATKRADIEGRIAALEADLPRKYAVAIERQATTSDAQATGHEHPQKPLIRAGESSTERQDEPEPSDARAHDIVGEAVEAWRQRESAHAVAWTVLRPYELKSSTPTLTIQPDNSVLASGDVTKSDTFDLTFRTPLKGITAIRLEAIPDDSLPNHGPGMVYYEGPIGDFCLSEISLTADGQPQKFTAAAHSFAAKGFPAEHAIDGDPQSSWMINGGQGKPHYAIFSLAEPTGDVKELKIHMLFERYYAAALGRFRISVARDPRTAKADVSLPSVVEDVLAKPIEKWSAADRQTVTAYFLNTVPQLAEANREIDKLRETLPKFATTLVMAERPAGHDRVTQRHHRGEFLQGKEAVTPGVPDFLPQLPPGTKRDRLALARWLVSPENPLTPRVIVNRYWAAFFGRGIVGTLGDFGTQGDLPTHPELLDWLAVEFVKNGWSQKKLHRLIVTSATYRQSSQMTPESLARDPTNELLSRGPRSRFEAEQIRDATLSAAGLLSEKIGGASVFPPQPPSVTTEGAYGALAWNPSTGEDRYRRSLYTFAKRTAPFAMANTFDAPSGEACVARREVSDTPLQALTLLNDAMFSEAAQALGKTYADKAGTDESRAAAIFRRCLTRPPDSDELALLADFARQQRARFVVHELDAAKVAGGSDGNVVERATWTVVTRAVFNLHEAVTKP
jgi:hypothetical protein